VIGGRGGMFGTGKGAAGREVLEALESLVMVADEGLTITYINPSLRALLSRHEPLLKRELPRFDLERLVGSNVDVFHKNPGYQRQMLARMENRHGAVIRIGPQAFDLKIMPLRRGSKRVGYVVEWADASARLQNQDLTERATAISEHHAMIEFSPDGVVVNANAKFL
jgi:methyl-accepting chemotaxis protein